MRSRILVGLVLGVGIFLAGASSTRAGIIVLNLGGSPYSVGGATLPADALQLKLEDTATNTVKLTIDGTKLPPDTDKLTGVVLNVNPTFASGSLSFFYTPGSLSELAATTVNFSPNSVEGWGAAGKFDLDFYFKPNLSFGPGDKSTYMISGSGLDVTDFLFESVNASQPQIAAFHLNVTGGDVNKSGMYGVVPEPATMAIWSAFGCLGALITWRRRRRAS